MIVAKNVLSIVMRSNIKDFCVVSLRQTGFKLSDNTSIISAHIFGTDTFDKKSCKAQYD